MPQICLALLRGVCQIPGYVAHEKGFLRERGIDARLDVAPTAWAVPERMIRGDAQFAMIPWTRVAAARAAGEPLMLLCGSGYEEAAIVVRRGIDVDAVAKIAVPQRGGMKDLTAMGLMHSLGWDGAETFRQPSGDGAIIALFGQGVDAASMVEPYATMMEELDVGRVVKRTGDLWPGAPGCSLATTDAVIAADPDLVQRVVDAFVHATAFTDRHRDEAAAIAARYIGVHERFIRKALERNRPRVDAIRNRSAMDAVISLMLERRYIERRPESCADLSFLDRATRGAAG